MTKIRIEIHQRIKAKTLVQTVDMRQICAGLLLLNRRKVWRKLSEFYKIPAGSLDGYSKGREVKNKEHRKIFHMPILAEAIACPSCGIVHVKKCPGKHKPKPILSIQQQHDKYIKEITSKINKAIASGSFDEAEEILLDNFLKEWNK